MDAQINDLAPSLNYRRVKHIHPKYGRKSVFETEGFRCKHCQAYVFTSPLISGVQNRNHCPYCLRSRHLDLYQAGDRLSACKGIMQPVGLTVKMRRNKYGRKHNDESLAAYAGEPHTAYAGEPHTAYAGEPLASQAGELMLIHRCSECHKVSINRIATDDSTSELESILRTSPENNRAILVELENMGIHLLQCNEAYIVTEQLFGKSNLKQQGLAQS